MGYQYLKDAKVRKDLNEFCLDILHRVQIDLKEYFTFDIRLIGSGMTKLMTINGEDNCIDLDYDLIIQRDKYDLVSEPRKIRELFLESFKKITKNINQIKVRNSKSVLTTYIGECGLYNFSFDCALLIEGNDNCLYKLVFDKSVQRFIWNKSKKSNNFLERFTFLKQQGYWKDIKDLYLRKKNNYKGSLSSSSILMETVNDIYQKAKNELR